PGHGADVGAPVSADLGLVPNAPDRDADKLPSERARDRLAEGGLPDARRPDEAEDRARRVLLQLRDGEVLDDALLDLLEVVVVLVENRAGMPEVQVVLGRRPPREREDPLEVGPDHPVLGRGRRELCQAVELPASLLVGFVGELRLLDLGAQLGDLGLLLVTLTELVLDRLQLLAQEVLPLALLHLGLDLRLDLRPELE